MTTQSDIAERFLMAWASGNTSVALGLCHTEFHFKGPIQEVNSAVDHLRALAGVASVVERVDVQRRFDDGDDVLLVYDLITRTPVGNARIAEWTTFRDGKIAEIRAYFDSYPWRSAGFGS